MSDIKYYALKKGEELPEEFMVIKHVNGEPEFVASYINTDYLSYQNGVLLKFHERNDKLRAENAKLRELAADMLRYIVYPYVCINPSVFVERARGLGVEVTE